MEFTEPKATCTVASVIKFLSAVQYTMKSVAQNTDLFQYKH